MTQELNPTFLFLVLLIRARVQIGIVMVTKLSEEAAVSLPLLQRAALLDPDDADVLYYLAYAYGKTGNRDEAKRLLRKVIRTGLQ